MKKVSFNPILLFLFYLFGWCANLYSQPQVAYAPEGVLQDDPIVAALDSLYKLDLFEKGYAKVTYPVNPRYNFGPDSVPRYDELIYEARLAKLDAISPFDLQYNAYVQGYIDMYIFRRREQVSRMMALSQLYFPMFEATLDKYNLPLELKYLAICESALNPLAKSRSAAMGLWQFMYPTGKIYGLKVSSYVDERCDPYKSTVAACEYFQYLYGLFGDWQMVLAAYNGGPGTVNKAIRRSGGKKTYWEIRPYLPTETQGYVPAFIAVNYVMNYTSEHNIRCAIPKKTFMDVDTVVVKKQLSFDQVSALLDIPQDELQYLNPSFRKMVIPVSTDQQSFITLPSNKIGAFISNEEKIYSYQNQLNSESVLAEQEAVKIHTIKPGEHLSTIAKKYGCTVADLKSWNGITSNSVKPGKKLTIYTFGMKPTERKAIPERYVYHEGKSQTTTENKTVTQDTKKAEPENKETINEAKTVSAENQTGQKNGDKPTTRYYTIKKGDSLYKIAQKYKTTVEEIKRLNNMGSHYNLLPGTAIKVSI